MGTSTAAVTVLAHGWDPGAKEAKVETGVQEVETGVQEAQEAQAAQETCAVRGCRGVASDERGPRRLRRVRRTGGAEERGADRAVAQRRMRGRGGRRRSGWVTDSLGKSSGRV